MDELQRFPDKDVLYVMTLTVFKWVSDFLSAMAVTCTLADQVPAVNQDHPAYIPQSLDLLPFYGAIRLKVRALSWQSGRVAVTDWRQLLRPDDGYELCPAATADEVAAVEAALDVVFPAQLRAVYQASNGLFDRPGEWFVIWPLPEVVTRNREAWSRTDSPARRRLVGFADDGTGAPFCVCRDGSAGVFAWSPTDSEATLLADTVAGFWSSWVAGMLPPH